ncbi:MAG: PilZ domain-containing protein [Mesorhizobium sp.]|nr:PilZ domain-containing protein [Mesorhizobium sp.]
MIHVATQNAARQPMPAERRLAGRRKALKSVTISFNAGTSTFEGVARNLSETGARLSFCETFAIPGEFLVRFGGEIGWRPAVARWRTMTDIGVAFHQP